MHSMHFTFWPRCYACCALARAGVCQARAGVCHFAEVRPARSDLAEHNLANCLRQDAVQANSPEVYLRDLPAGAATVRSLACTATSPLWFPAVC